jgi:hypothetical protein
MTSNNKFKNWLPVIIFMIIAIGLRLRCNSSENHYLLAGSDGPYLPVQVKSLFEHFRLAFPDMPLLFVICTLVAKLLYLFRLGTENECILMSIRFIDSFLPPLTAIPVFYIAKELNFETTQAKFSNYLTVAFSILSFTPLFLFSFQLQKNGIATLLIFSYLYYVLKILKYKTGEDTIKAVIVLFLCAFTHFGSFGIMVFISLLVFSVWLFSQKNKFKIQTVKISLGAVGVFISTFSLIAIFDYTRFLRIINVPFKLFEAPALLFALNGQNFILYGPNLFILISMNLLAFTGIVFLILKRKQIDSDKLILGLAVGFCTLFFSNPFLGLEWASRLFMMAYIPVTVMYLIIYNSGSSYWIKIPTLSLFSLLTALSIGTTVFDRPPKSIDNESFKELQQMSDKGLF